MDIRTCLIGISPLIIAAGSHAAPIYSNDFESPTPTTNGGSWTHSLRTNLGGPYTTVLGRFSSNQIGFTLHATAENTAGLGGSGGDGGTPGADQFNLHVDQHHYDHPNIPGLDGSGGGGGDFGGHGNGVPDVPRLSLGGAIGNGGGDNGDHSGEVIFGAGTYALTFDLMLFDSWDGNYEGFGPDSFAVDINGERKFDELLEVQIREHNFRLPDELPEQNVYNQRWQDQIYRNITLEFEVGEATDQFSFNFIGTLNQAINDESWGIDNVRVDQLSVSRSMSAPAVPAPGTLAMLGMGLGLGTRRNRKSA